MQTSFPTSGGHIIPGNDNPDMIYDLRFLILKLVTISAAERDCYSSNVDLELLGYR